MLRTSGPDGAIAVARPLSRESGLAWGFLGVLAFSFTVPFTRVADRDLSPLFVGAGRAVIVAGLAAVALALTRSRVPTHRQWLRLAVVGGGIVVAFPLLTSVALTRVPASHGAVVIALLPAATATAVVIRTGEHPPRRFWAAAIIGAAAAVFFAFAQSGFGHPQLDDLLLLGAVIAAAIGYAEGGLVSRELGSWQTVSWALVLCAPLMVALTIISVLHRGPIAGAGSWLGFAYVSLISMYLGYFAWYRGLALGPMAQVSQIQLTQPVLSICWSALILSESIGWVTVLGAFIVILSAATAVRARLPGQHRSGERAVPTRRARSSNST